MNRTGRANRIGIGIVGVLLLAAGGALSLASHRGLGRVRRSDVLYPSGARDFVHANRAWLWPVVAIAAVLIGLIFLRWLLSQARADRLGRLHIGADGGLPGRTSLNADALTGVIEDELTELSGVRRAVATLSGRPDRPQLRLRVVVDPHTDLELLRTQLAERSLPDARTALELAELPTYLRLTITRYSKPDRTTVVTGS